MALIPERRCRTVLRALTVLYTFAAARAFAPIGTISLKRATYVDIAVALPAASNDDADGSTARENGVLSRRDALRAPAGLALASLLTSAPRASLATSGARDYAPPPQTVLITGSNSGIGLDAATRLAAGGHRVVLACRTLDKAKRAADRIAADVVNSAEDTIAAIQASKGVMERLIPMECDLASLESVQSFAKNLEGKVDRLDAACYNAGLARDTSATEVARTKEGFELTVGTNHLGHFYLNHLLLPKIKRNTGRIVVTASSVHDPESPGGAQGKTATLGNLSGLEGGPSFEMVDGKPFNADKAYKDSKLCNVLFTRELQKRLDSANTGINANCFTPGLIVGTGLFRDQNPLFTKVFDVAATNLLKVGESTHWGGGSLEYMALDKSVGSQGGLYYSSPPGSSKFGDAAFGDQFTVSGVSKEAMDDEKAKRLWELSEKLVGISA